MPSCKELSTGNTADTKPIKMIVFDLVGTLISGDAFREARRKVGIDSDTVWNAADAEADFEHCFDYEKIFGVIFGVASGRNKYVQFRDHLVSEVNHHLFPDVCEVLHLLNDRKIAIGFVTDGTRDVEQEMILSILSHCKIESQGPLVITAEKVGAKKKSGQPFAELITQMKGSDIRPEDIVVVGDNLEADIYGPKKADTRLRTALLCRGSIALEPQAAHTDFQIASLMDMLNVPGMA